MTSNQDTDYKPKGSFLLLLSSPLAGKRDIVVTMSVCPSGFVRSITCTIMHGFQNNLAQLLPLRRGSAI